MKEIGGNNLPLEDVAQESTMNEIHTNDFRHTFGHSNKSNMNTQKSDTHLLRCKPADLKENAAKGGGNANLNSNSQPIVHVVNINLTPGNEVGRRNATTESCEMEFANENENEDRENGCEAKNITRNDDDYNDNNIGEKMIDDNILNRDNNLDT